MKNDKKGGKIRIALPMPEGKMPGQAGERLGAETCQVRRFFIQKYFQGGRQHETKDKTAAVVGAHAGDGRRACAVDQFDGES